jgi:hypothetical protein
VAGNAHGCVHIGRDRDGRMRAGRAR